MKSKINNQLMKALQPQAKPYEVFDTDLGGLILRVEPSGTMSYYAAYRLKATNKRGRYLIGRYPAISPMQARDEAKRVLGEVAKGNDPMGAVRSARQLAKRMTLGEFIDGEYGKWAETRFSNHSEVIRRLNVCFAGLRSTKIEDLSVFALERLKSERLKKEIKGSTINRDLGLLRSALTKAVEWGVVSENPLDRLKLIKVPDDKRVRYLDDEEESNLLTALDAREESKRAARDRFNVWQQERNLPVSPSLRDVHFTDHIKPMVLLSLHTGMRQGEVFKLAWSDVDLVGSRLKVRGANAKSGKARFIPLNAVALKVLKDWKTQCQANAILVFPNKGGVQMDTVKTAWSGVLKAANITGFRWHDMRHHFASRLVMSGVDLNTVRELLGHADLKMTLRYAHLGNEFKASAVERLVKAA